MYVYCNFYCSPAKKHGSDPPHFFGAGDATGGLVVSAPAIGRNRYVSSIPGSGRIYHPIVHWAYDYLGPFGVLWVPYGIDTKIVFEKKKKKYSTLAYAKFVNNIILRFQNNLVYLQMFYIWVHTTGWSLGLGHASYPLHGEDTTVWNTCCKTYLYSNYRGFDFMPYNTRRNVWYHWWSAQ